MTLLAGCGAVAQRVQDATHSFEPGAHEEAIRKQAQADSFPDARNAGL